MSVILNDNEQSQIRIKISANYTITMLLMIGASILSLVKYLEEKIS